MKERVMYIGQPAGNGADKVGILPPLSRMLCRCNRGFWLLSREVIPMKNWLSGKTEKIIKKGGKNIMRWKWLISVGLVVSLLMAFALPMCAPAPPVEEEKPMKTVKIGGTVPLSGECAYWGICLMEGWETAAEEINAAGGIKVGDETYKMEVITYDSKNVVADSRAATTRLVFEDKVKYMFATPAATTIGMLGISEPNEVLSMAACWGYIELIGPEYFYGFRLEMTDYESGFQYIPAMFRYYGRDKLESCFFIGPDDKDGYDCHYSYTLLMDHYGIEDLGYLYFEWTVTDFYPIVTRALAANPDFIICSPLPAGTTASIVKAAREMGYEGPIVSTAAGEVTTILEICGEFADDVIVSGYPYYTNIEGIELTDFQKRMREKLERKYGHFYELSGGYTWWAYALKKAFEASGTVTDTRAVANALEKVEMGEEDCYMGEVIFAGKARYGLPRQVVYDNYTYIIEDGVARLLEKGFPELPPEY